MRRDSIHLCIARVPRDYAPAYPRQLTQAEFRELIAARLSPRIAKFAASVSLALSLAACESRSVGPLPRPNPTRPTAPPDLESKVMAVLRGLHANTPGGNWYASSRFSRVPAEQRRFASHQWNAHIPICYGNSYSGIFDVHAARRLAASAFEAYGIQVKRNVDLRSQTLEARIDGIDAATGLGFELREGAADQESPFRNASPTEPIDPATRLDENEIPELANQGLRVHVADPQSLWDGDQFTAQITYLAAILDFLNEATDGSDFDIGPFLFEQLELITVKPEVVPEPRFAPSDESEWVRFSTSALQRVTLSVIPEKIVKIECEDFDSNESMRNQTRTPTERLSNRGKPTVVIASVYSSKPKKARLVQSLGPDSTESIVESTNGIFLMPAGFDAAKPFRIEFEFQAGAEVQVSRVIRIGLPAR